MRTPPFILHLPESLAEALDLSSQFVSANTEFDWIAGGTDLLPNYKWHLNSKGHVISLAKVEELTKHTATHIGAMVRLHDLAESPLTHPLISKASESIASVLIRQSATVGGNLCLDTRCFWFNQTEDWRRSIEWCHKCDYDTGADCRVIPNQNTLCVATYQADLAPVLMCLGAVIHLASVDDMRSMPLEDFFQLDGISRNILQPGEMITHVTLDERAISLEGDYQKLRLRESWDFPEAGVAAAWRLDEQGIPLELRIATTGCESIPKLHAEEVASFLSSWDSSSSIDSLAEAVKKSIKPVNNTAFPPRYRRKMLRVLTKRALSALRGL